MVAVAESPSPAGNDAMDSQQGAHTSVTAASPSPPADTDTQTKKCKRPGCGKGYTDAENTSTASPCIYHKAMPIFHDGVKTWPCCHREAWDWEEFMRIPGCARGIHTDAKEPCNTSRSSSTTHTVLPVSHPAAATTVSPTTTVVVRNIEDYNRQQQRQKEVEEAERSRGNATAASPQEKPFVTAEGKYKCVNKGCNKEYLPEENTGDACRYHPGQPIFRDCMKSWTCCNAKSYDWDEFMQLPPCHRGKHTPKMVAQ